VRTSLAHVESVTIGNTDRVPATGSVFCYPFTLNNDFSPLAKGTGSHALC
jgi:hypothetical protein